MFGLPVALAVSKSNYLLSLKPTETPYYLFVCTCIIRMDWRLALAVSKSNHLLLVKPTAIPYFLFVCSCIIRMD